MSSNGHELDRRDFIKTMGAGLALGGGVLAMNTAQASAPSRVSVSDWSRPAPFATPHHLSDQTHVLAQRGLAGEHGRALVNADFKIDEQVTKALSPDMHYAHAVRLMAEKAPLRVLPGERIIGSATLRESSTHKTPVFEQYSTSHLTIGFDQVLPMGYKGLREKIQERLSRGGLDEQGTELLHAMQMCLDGAAIWNQRHIELLGQLATQSSGPEQANYLHLRDILQRVPENPPATFEEAVQSLWSMFAFQRLCGTWSGIGRIDQMLGGYLKKDLAEKRITLDEARELLAHFWIKGTEWTGANPGPGSGDAQFYQNVILAGVDAQGQPVLNDVTYLVLDVVEELHISDFPIAVRVSENTPKKLLRRVAEVQRHGGGIVALYQEDVVIAGLVKLGYPLEEARKFANDGCWEAQVPGATCFSYVAFDMLGILQRALKVDKPEEAVAEFADFEGFYTAFRTEMTRVLDEIANLSDGHAMADPKTGPPTPLVSMFIDDCIERGRGYYNRGARYNVVSPHAGGMANVANSLQVIKRLVYEEKAITLPELVATLRSDWKGQEPMRRLILNRFEFYGNDNEQADAMMQRLFNDYTDLVWRTPERNGVLRPAGISTFGREIFFSHESYFGCTPRLATADGHHQGEFLATNFSPSPGTDQKGPSAALNSYCKMDFSRAPNGATLELKIHPSCLQGDAGVDALVGLMRGFIRQEGWFMHVDVVDSAMLLDAQKHPEKYPNLPVRVAGWSARFATLDKEWQDMVINRTQQII